MERRDGRLLQRDLQLLDVIAVGQRGGRLVRYHADGARSGQQRVHRTVRGRALAELEPVKAKERHSVDEGIAVWMNEYAVGFVLDGRLAGLKRSSCIVALLREQ